MNQQDDRVRGADEPEVIEIQTNVPRADDPSGIVRLNPAPADVSNAQLEGGDAED
jgi:hypothetical protein